MADQVGHDGNVKFDFQVTYLILILVGLLAGLLSGAVGFGGGMVLLEYGVGFNTPTIIRFPFERMAASYPDVTLIRINKEHRDCQTSGIRHFIGLETL